MTTLEEVIAAADEAMEEAYVWIDSDEDIDLAANFICSTAEVPLDWYWEDATPGCGVVFVGKTT